MKLSGYQLFWITSISSMIMFTYIPITLALNEARQDAWISILLGGAVMLAVNWLVLRVCIQNEDKSLVRMMKDLLGTVLGKIIVTAYFAHWFLQMSATVKDMVNFQNLVMLHNTPMPLILFCMLFLVLYAVYKGGLTVISRCAEVIGPIFLFTLFVQLFLNPQQMNLKRILPVYADSGWLNIGAGALSSFNYMMDPSIILMLFFFAESKRAASRAVLWGTAVSVAWGLLATLVLLAVTGPDMASKMVVPVYSLTKMVSILNFIQNIDAFFIPLWLLGAFIKLTTCLFILSYGLSEWSGYRNWRRIACALTVVWLAYIIYSARIVQFSYMFRSPWMTGVFFPMLYVGFPLLLWIVGSVRKRHQAAGYR
ncbi:GerAB/ArcD/ProY family transporter [Cohnella sp. JJ-181]|uniref:GerAB/ArcD/ProY family transporter n=1 Tax=Cohnella rhizoplanae TaxID=2974897 RepID=UPI0022FF8F37|nr:endospore germination permease [Cohnella sp. JJ-181]CAI6067724.1 hypothetical protein COHCIP112018_02152 [Cohnella sp. JJ-181]